MRTFVYTDDKSNKFWHIDLQGSRFLVTFGKVGSIGQTQVKDFPDDSQARKAHDKLVAEKLAKGYVETTKPAPAPAAPVSPLQRSLEEALAENPDDLATHSAYADYLMEQNDPRGEFVQVQLALEKAGGKERIQLEKRAAELLAPNAARWLGEMGRFLVGDWSGEDKPFYYRFARGWLDYLRVLPAPEPLFAALARSPEARLLRHLEIIYDMQYHPFDFDQFLTGPNGAMNEGEETNELYEGGEVLGPLVGSPYLTNLRVLKVGFSDGRDSIGHSTMVEPFGQCDADQVIGLLKQCPDLEELYLNDGLNGIEKLFAEPALGQVRVLQYYYASAYYRHQGERAAFPLQVLADNPALTRLTTLRLLAGRDAVIEVPQVDAVLRSPHLNALTELQVSMTPFGDAGCRAIIESGALRRLTVLDLRYTGLTDEGARMLAECPDLKRLQRLDVANNLLTPAGVAALERTGVRVQSEAQSDPGDEDYYYDCDFE